MRTVARWTWRSSTNWSGARCWRALGIETSTWRFRSSRGRSRPRRTWRERSVAGSSGAGGRRFRESGPRSSGSGSGKRGRTVSRLKPMKSNKAVVKMMRAAAEPEQEKSIAPLVEEMIATLGEDPKREGLLRTPDRVDKAMKFLLSGYGKNIQTILNGALYEVKYDEM